MDTGADACVICCDLLGIELETYERHPGYFAIRCVSSFDNVLTMSSSFVGVSGLNVECQAKLVNRRSLPNAGAGVSIIIGQRVFPHVRIF